MDQVTTGPVPDDEELTRFGYRQQFVRSLRHFESFAVAFSFISITTGIFTTYGFALATGGTRAIWTWPIVIVGQALVVLVYGALSARVPLSGYSYQWASRLANVTVGWWFGWMSFAFLTIVTVSVDYGLVQVAFQPLIGETYTPTSAALETLVVLALQAALIIASTRVTTRVNNAAVATEIIGIAGLTVLLLIVAAVRSMGHSPPGYLVAVALRGGGRPEIGGGRGRWPARTGAALTSSPRRARPRWSGPWRTCGGSRARGRPVSAGSGWTRHDSRTPGRSRGRASRPAAGQAAALVPAGVAGSVRRRVLAMVEDGLDGRPPGWRLRLSVIWAGLRERARRAVPAALRRMTADADPPAP